MDRPARLDERIGEERVYVDCSAPRAMVIYDIMNVMVYIGGLKSEETQRKAAER